MREGILDLLIAVAASSGLSSLIVAFVSRGKRKSERRNIDIDSTAGAVDIWKKTAEGLDEKLDKLQQERDELAEQLRDLQSRMDHDPNRG